MPDQLVAVALALQRHCPVRVLSLIVHLEQAEILFLPLPKPNHHKIRRRNVNIGAHDFKQQPGNFLTHRYEIFILIGRKQLKDLRFLLVKAAFSGVVPAADPPDMLPHKIRHLRTERKLRIGKHRHTNRRIQYMDDKLFYPDFFFYHRFFLPFGRTRLNVSRTITNCIFPDNLSRFRSALSLHNIADSVPWCETPPEASCPHYSSSGCGPCQAGP